jgi:hypothetical protein
VSSSEPRLTPRSGSQRELTGEDVNPLKSNVPFATHILLVGSMLLFFLAATLITLQASWEWWLIPAVVAVPVVIVLTQRYLKVQKAREARRLMESELRAARNGSGQSGLGR